MPDIIQRYGWNWDAATPDLEIELQAIRWGGEWRVKGGQWCGRGLFYHYRRAMECVWPQDDHHRWSDLMIKTYLMERITVVQGPKDSSKTRTASKLALIDYWVYPDETLILISSTDLRGADYRVWGDIKSLLTRAREVCDWLPGRAIESKHCICTDDLEESEVRDPRKGMVFIPCFGSGGQWLGLKRYCFPAGTPVDTPHGQRPIESLQVGDDVITAIGLSKIANTSNRCVDKLVRLTLSDGRQITCTADHPIFSELGWLNAACIPLQTYLLSPYEAMRILREGSTGSPLQHSFLFRRMLREALDEGMCGLWNPVLRQGSSRNLLFQDLFGEMDLETAGFQRENSCPRQIGLWMEDQCIFAGQQKRDGEAKMLYERARGSHPRNGVQEIFQWQTFPHGCRESVISNVSKSEARLPHTHRGQFQIAPIAFLQSGFGLAKNQTDRGSGRLLSPMPITTREGQQAGHVFNGARLAHIEVLQSPNTDQHKNGRAGYKVYDLEIEGHPSFSVNGILVHNCGIKQKRRRLIGCEVQFMQGEYVDVLSNLNSGDFKAWFEGNTIGENDPLDRLGEPEGGWGTEGEIKKTTTWRNKFGGVTICLYGPDSPNFDYPQPNGLKHFPYLIGQKDIDWIASTYGKDSSKYWMQAIGVRRAGITARRVITQQLCEENGALEPVIWSGQETTMVAALDAAYGGVGGDRCVLQVVEFGPAMLPAVPQQQGMIYLPAQVNPTKIMMKCYPPVLVPVSVTAPGAPEDQIAIFCKNHCERMGIQASHFFFDGRGTLAMSLARIWSPNCNSVEFGGTATSRPVSQDHWVWDEELHCKRLKRCDEEYSRFVTELWFTTRYIIMSGQLRELPRETMQEGCRREWKTVRGDRHEVETKAEMKERTNQSPDLYDSFACACEGARRLGFQISKMGNAAAAASSNQWIEDMARKTRELHQSKELVPT